MSERSGSTAYSMPFDDFIESQTTARRVNNMQTIVKGRVELVVNRGANKVKL